MHFVFFRCSKRTIPHLCRRRLRFRLDAVGGQSGGKIGAYACLVARLKTTHYSRSGRPKTFNPRCRWNVCFQGAVINYVAWSVLTVVKASRNYLSCVRHWSNKAQAERYELYWIRIGASLYFLFSMPCATWVRFLGEATSRGLKGIPADQAVYNSQHKNSITFPLFPLCKRLALEHP